jgi:hypothetical protein
MSNEALLQLSEQAFTNVGKYLQSELSSTWRRARWGAPLRCGCRANTLGRRGSVTREDYKLLETMNRLSKDKYGDMLTQAEALNGAMARLHEKCPSALVPAHVPSMPSHSHCTAWCVCRRVLCASAGTD